ncbi:ThuA domain-containing protein [Leifsonia sp. P73]|uniref:ThuA domain-containing protein n=1 Tax=Leifsonia sp. P73 TaxID=3423959 RepID=UPI003DA2E6C0
MTDTLNALILSGHMTREHDNEHRSFRQHNVWLTQLLEDTGRFRVRVVEDPRGLGAEIIDKYDVVIVVFEGRDGYHEKAVGFGAETDAALLKFVRDDGKGIVWFHGSAAQEDDWGYPDEYNVLRGSRLTVAGGLRPRPWGEAQLDTVEPRHAITDGISARWTVTGDDILTGVEILDGAQVLLTTYDDLESYERAPVWPMSHYPVAIPEEGIAALPGMNTDQPIAWINEHGAGRSFTITIGHDIDTFRRIEFIRMFPRGVEWAATGEVTLNGPDRRGERRFLPWPYYNHEG